MAEEYGYLWKDALFSKPLSFQKFRHGLALFLSEMLGVCLFVNLGCASLVSTALVPNVLDHFNATIAFILGIGMSVWIAHPISKSVLNPSLTIALIILKHLSLMRGCLYICGQLLGGFLGVLINYLLVPDLKSDYCRAKRHPEVNPMIAFLYEVLSTALLAWALCALVDKRRIGSIRNLTMKFIVVLIPIILNMTALFGSGVNPAFAFGGYMVSLNFTEFWIFIFGPITGASSWAILYRLMFDPSVEEKSEAKTLYNVVE